MSEEAVTAFCKENIAYCTYEEIASQSVHEPETLEYFYERVEDVKSEGKTQIKEIFTDEEKSIGKRLKN